MIQISDLVKLVSQVRKLQFPTITFNIKSSKLIRSHLLIYAGSAD